MNLSANRNSCLVVAMTPRHSIMGEIGLREKRLADLINDRVDSAIFLRNVSISRLDAPDKVLHKLLNAAIPKHGILLLFEPPKPEALPAPRQFTFGETVKNDIFLVADRMEVRGMLATKGNLDVIRFLANLPDAFIPITQASVVFGSSYNVVLHQETILVNTQHIRFLGQCQPETPPPPVRTIN